MVILNTGCAVGPDYERPQPPTVTRYTNEPLQRQTRASDIEGGGAQEIVEDDVIPEKWWELFDSDSLDTLVEDALKANPTIDAAQASLSQARENLYAAYGSFLPAIDASTNATREKISSATFGAPGEPNPIFTLYNASVNVSYAFDFFGSIRRQVEGLQAQASEQRYQYEATYLTLAANVVTTAVQEAALRGQIIETQKIIDIEQQELDALEYQFRLRVVTVTPLLLQRATLAQTQANLASLKKQRAQKYNQLAILCGHFPGDEITLIPRIGALRLPRKLPLSLPSKLVEQRPDIRASEEELHAASAQVGVATAAMLPQITLNGSYGAQALAGVNRLSSPSANIWNIAAGLTQPIFHGGQLLHQRRAASAGYDKALAQYKNTVLVAFQNVADTLNALQYDSDTLAAQVAGEKAATGSLTAARVQFKAGIIGYLTLLDTERTYQQARISLIQAQANRYADTAALFQALGGGWWNRKEEENKTP